SQRLDNPALAAVGRQPLADDVGGPSGRRMDDVRRRPRPSIRDDRRHPFPTATPSTTPAGGREPKSENRAVSWAARSGHRRHGMPTYGVASDPRHLPPQPGDPLPTMSANHPVAEWSMLAGEPDPRCGAY